MKILMYAAGGGSGGLKNYIKGYLQYAYVDSTIEIVFVCTSELAKSLNNVASNVRIIATDFAVQRMWDCILNRPLNENIIKIINKENPDLVYFITGIIPKNFTWNKIAVEMHNQLYIDDNILKKQGFTKTAVMLYTIRRLVRKSIRMADFTIFDSKYSQEQAIETGIYPQKSTYSYFGVVAEERVNALTRTYSLHKPIRLLYISTLFPYKNHIPLLQGIKLLKDKGHDFILDIVGSGPSSDVKRVEDEIAKLNLTSIIRIHGWVEHSDIYKMIDESDIFLYASSIETSGFGLMEGMVRGAVIACHQESCMPEILSRGGVLFNVYDKNNTAEAIESLINDETLRMSISKKAFDISKNYTWENHNKKIFDFLKQNMAD
jgi:glycosyltransferase involved in cell wall biosynthesis